MRPAPDNAALNRLAGKFSDTAMPSSQNTGRNALCWLSVRSNQPVTGPETITTSSRLNSPITVYTISRLASARLRPVASLLPAASATAFTAAVAKPKSIRPKMPMTAKISDHRPNRSMPSWPMMYGVIIRTTTMLIAKRR